MAANDAEAEYNFDYNLIDWEFTLDENGTYSLVPPIVADGIGEPLEAVNNIIPTDAESIGAPCVIQDSKEDDPRDYDRVWKPNADVESNCPDRSNKDYKPFDNNGSYNVMVTEIDK